MRGGEISKIIDIHYLIISPDYALELKKKNEESIEEEEQKHIKKTNKKAEEIDFFLLELFPIF